MAFCSKCNNQNAEGSRFCAKCGTPIAASPPPAVPRTVTVGQVKKCPACGNPLESFQGRCAGCGHELNTGASEISLKLAAVNEASDVTKIAAPNTRETLIEFAMFLSGKIRAETETDNLRIYRGKLLEVYNKAQLVLANDKENLAIIKDFLDKADDRFKHRKRKAGLKVFLGITIPVAAITLIIVLIASGAANRRAYRAGLDIIIPAYVIIPPERVIISGGLGRYFRAAGTGVTMSTGTVADNVVVSMNMEIEALADINAMIQQEARRVVAAQGIPWRDQQVNRRWMGSSFEVVGSVSRIGVDDDEVFGALQRMRSGETQTILLFGNYNFPAERRAREGRYAVRRQRERATEFLNSHEITLVLSSVRFSVRVDMPDRRFVNFTLW